MSRTNNKHKTRIEKSLKKNGLSRKLRRAIEGNRFSICICDPDTPWKYGKPERNFQSDRNKGWKKVSGKKFRTYLKRDANREIMEELEE